CLTHLQLRAENRYARAKTADGADEMARRGTSEGIALCPVIVVVILVDRGDEHAHRSRRENHIALDGQRRTRERDGGIGKGSIHTERPQKELIAPSALYPPPAQTERVPEPIEDTGRCKRRRVEPSQGNRRRARHFF